MTKDYLDLLGDMVNGEPEMSPYMKMVMGMLQTAAAEDKIVIVTTPTGRHVHERVWEMLGDSKSARRNIAPTMLEMDYSGSATGRFAGVKDENFNVSKYFIIDEIGQMPPLKFWDGEELMRPEPKSSHRINHKGKGPRNKWGAHK